MPHGTTNDSHARVPQPVLSTSTHRPTGGELDVDSVVTTGVDLRTHNEEIITT